MCNHCGCRDFAPIGELTADHEIILGRAWAIAEATRAGESTPAVDFDALLELLDLHVVKEETGLYPELIAIGEVSVVLVEELEEEHREIRRRLASHSFDRRDYYELAAHIETEEEEMFPLTSFGFDEDDWEVMARAHRAAEAAQAVTSSPPMTVAPHRH